MIKLKNPGEGVIGMDHEKLMRILTNSEFVDATSPWIKVSGQEPGNFMK